MGVGVFAPQIFSVGVCMYHMLRPGGADFDTRPRSLGKGDVDNTVVCCRRWSCAPSLLREDGRTIFLFADCGRFVVFVFLSFFSRF